MLVLRLFVFLVPAPCSPSTYAPHGTSRPFGPQRPPLKIDPQVPLGVRGALACNGLR
jgi:hypothetical protein